jgi:glycosyltransferase involved in cell wall biosynthesis
MSGSPPRRLLHVYPSFALGGAQRRFVQIANHFGRDYRHTIISLDGDVSAAAGLSGEVDATMLPIAPPRRRLSADLPSFAAILRDQRPDLLVTLNWGSIEWAMAARLLGQPHLHLEDGFGAEESARQLWRRVWTRRLVLRRASVVLPSRQLYRLALDHWRLPRRTLLYLPNGVDLDRFHPRPDSDFARRYGLASDRPVIGTVAALRREKALDRLIEAFALIRRQHDAQLAIIGDGPEGPALRQLAQRLGLAADVIFTGACAEPERLLPSLSLFALSSDTEQMPLSLLEAMACGLAAVCTDVGDVRTMLAANNRPFITARDRVALAQAMAALLNQPELRADIGAANRRRVEQEFSQSAMFAAYRRLYDGAPAALISAGS